MIFPTQFIVNNHTQEFWFKNFSDGFPINCSDIHWLALFLAEKHMKYVFVIFKDTLLTFSYSAMIAKSLLIIIDPILETNDIRTTWKQVGVTSEQHRFSIFAHNTQIIYIDQKE